MASTACSNFFCERYSAVFACGMTNKLLPAGPGVSATAGTKAASGDAVTVSVAIELSNIHPSHILVFIKAKAFLHYDNWLRKTLEKGFFLALHRAGSLQKGMSVALKKLHIKTWGCQMNVYDSNRIADVLAPLGYKTSDTPDDADMIILNTCHIREKATEKVFSELGRMRAYKRKGEESGKKVLLGVAGCVAQAEGDVIIERAPYVDLVFGPQTYHNLAEMVADLTGLKQKRIVNTDFPIISKFDHLPEEHVDVGPSAYLSVQEGCDKFCTFCVVPYTRGSEYSRPVAQIIDEAKRLAAAGARELTLLGQNVNAYHGDGKNLAQLMYEIVEKVPQIERLRYTTSHPRDMDDSLIAAHRDLPQLTPYLHLPVQSGSNKILKAMNRKHERDMYFEIIDKLRNARPDIALSSDFIIGFPGETDQDFEDTLDLIRHVNYGSAYCFKYSQRPGTPAAVMTNLVAEKIKDERHAIMFELLNKQQTEFNENTVGQIMPVLLDRMGVREGQLMGRTPYNQSITLENIAPVFYGTTPLVRITRGTVNGVKGELVQEALAA